MLALSLSLYGVHAGAESIGVDRVQSESLLLAQSSGISADQAATIVRNSTGGRILSVERQDKKGGSVYRVKVLMSDGRVRVIRVNADSGKISG